MKTFMLLDATTPLSFRATIRNPLARLLAVFGAIMLFAVSGWSLANSVSGATAAQLAAAIQGPGITITNPVLKRGSAQQAGTFSNGIAGAKLEIDSGIILTGMSVAESFTTNSSWQTSLANGNITPDNDLLAIDAKAKYDTVVFEFDVTLGANTKLLMVDYQFASEEYNEYVGSQFNDAFGFFVSGGDLTKTYNIARVVGKSTIVTTANIGNYVPVTVNNVNNGTLGAYRDGTPAILTNSQYFINNCKKGTGIPDCTQANPPVDVEYDGLTHKLHATLDNLTPGVTYHFKMALADTGDNQWDTGVFVDKIMGIRAPQLCYDYAYKQNDQFITNKKDYNETAPKNETVPQIVANLNSSANVEVSIYINNQETSELTAQNLKVSINDINTTQATYVPQSVNVILPNKTALLHIPDNSQGMTVANDYIHNIPIDGGLEAKEYFYTKYELSPSVHDLNMSLNATLSFGLEIQGSTIPFYYTIGSSKLPMCISGALSYTPGAGIYNMVDQRANLGAALNANSTSVKNNLPTQVASRPTQLEIVSYDPLDFNRVKASNTMLAVEIIDVGGYFDINASCADPSSAITSRAWVQFGEVDGNVTHTPFISASDYYKNVRENAAYRLSYNLADDNGTLQVDKIGPDNYKLVHFTADAAGEFCQESFIPSIGNSMATAAYCGSNGSGGGNSGMTGVELQRCMECIFGLKTKRICSRDNFAIRPESFDIKIKDPIGLIVIPYDANLSAGYMYRFDINATSHVSSSATPGYVASYSSTSPSLDQNATLNWKPNGRIVTDCNTTSPSMDFYFSAGKIVSKDINHTNVGRYELKIRDKMWTKVDQAPFSHHSGNSNWLSGDDCSGGSAVPLYNSGDSYVNNMVGCEISSKHTNLNVGINYDDYNLTFKPDHFGLASIDMSTGTEFNITSINKNVWTYMNNIADDPRMGLRYSGQIRAQGDDNGTLTNFVTNCYAEPVNLDLNLTFPITAGLPNWRYRLQEVNATTIWRDSNAIIAAPATNVSFPLLTIPQTSFLKNQNGLVDVNLSINFDRNLSQPFNPITVSLNNLQVKCQMSVDCKSIANGTVNHLPDMNISTDSNVTFVYGRVIPRDVRIFGNVPFIANAWYETFNAPALNGIPLSASRNEAMWYINTLHGDVPGQAPAHYEGDANVTFINSVATHNMDGVSVLGVETYNFGARAIGGYKAHIDTDPWLWYGVNALPYADPGTNVDGTVDAAITADDCLNHPCFNINVVNNIGRAGSATSDALKDEKTNKESQQPAGIRYDYTPAIR